MTLFQSAVNVQSEDRERALRRVFESKYAWLLRWALHFTESDRAAAEDLVQETFVRLLMMWDTLRDLDDLEPLLYSYLRYAHLSERRRGRSHAFQRLSSVDFDTLAITLRSSLTFDQIEVQNELRQILLFLLWRRCSARFASMFLLRFFHGYFPEEIASICRIKRFGVDLGLRQARSELKTHLADPRHVQVFGRSVFADARLPKRAVPTEEFEQELRQEIFASPNEECPSQILLEGYYRSPDMNALETTLLAHIVACERCLNKVSQESGTTPPASRSMDESLTRAPRVGPKSVTKGHKEILARVFQVGEDRLREIYEHQPTGLVIALNGEVVAVRDIQSEAARATLKVETRDVQKLEMIEVFSEQGMLLLSLPLLTRPPKTQPELHRETLLSNERTLNLVVRFTRDGALIEATYEDPRCAENTGDTTEPALLSPDEDRLRWNGVSGDAEHAMPANRANRWRWTRPRWLNLRPVMTKGFAALVSITATVIALVFLLQTSFENRQKQSMDANQVLRAASRAEASAHALPETGAVDQRVRIRLAGRTQERDLHRDLSGKRRPKQSPMDPDESSLRQELAEANIDWDNPLSAQDFRDWHDHLFEEQDHVARMSGNVLIVSTEAEGGPVAKESLTVKADDFRAVARTVVMRDGTTVDVAELSYQVVPWGPAVEDWFLPSSDSSRSRQHKAEKLPAIVAPKVNDSQLDFAELSTQLALIELHAETERLQVVRSASGIQVVGVVESDERKAEIQNRLSSIAHVRASISSYRDLAQRTDSVGSVSRLRSVTAAAGDSPLTNECKQRKIVPDDCRRLSYALLNAATVLVHESIRIDELRTKYPAEKHMGDTSQQLLAAIATTRFQHIDQALKEQEHILQSLGVTSAQDDEKSSATQSFFRGTAEGDLTLCKQLIYAGDQPSRSTSDMLRDLAHVVKIMRGAATHEAANFPLPSSFSSKIAPPRL